MQYSAGVRHPTKNSMDKNSKFWLHYTVFLAGCLGGVSDVLSGWTAFVGLIPKTWRGYLAECVYLLAVPADLATLEACRLGFVKLELDTEGKSLLLGTSPWAPGQGVFPVFLASGMAAQWQQLLLLVLLCTSTVLFLFSLHTQGVAGGCLRITPSFKGLCF